MQQPQLDPGVRQAAEHLEQRDELAARPGSTADRRLDVQILDVGGGDPDRDARLAEQLFDEARVVLRVGDQ